MAKSEDIERRETHGKLIVLTGPTATGKSAVGLFLAQCLNVEIVSADSMQVYRGMDIGTAKPSIEEQRSVRHHLIDIRYPWEPFNAGAFVREAWKAMEEIWEREHVPIVVGGTALYLKALLEGLFDGPEADWELRARLRQLAAEQGNEALHARLARVDPEAAQRIHPNDLVRLVRALEVWEKQRTPISALQQQFGRPREELRARVFWLTRKRADLIERIDRRVDAMFSDGLVAETRNLVTHPRGIGRQASQALGYRQVIDYLNGRLTLEECVAAVKTATHRFARQQQNWERHFAQATRIEIAPNETPKSVAERIASMLRM